MKAFQRAWRGGKNEWRMHMVTALSSSVAFLCLALALLMVVNLRQLQSRWESVGRLSVYLLANAEASDGERIVSALSSTPGVKEARFVSSHAARRGMLSDAPTEVLQALPLEAFPASVEVTFDTGQTAEEVQSVAGRVSQLKSVESIETYGSWSERVSRFLGFTIVAAVGLAAIVFFAVVTTVSSATKLMLERRRTEVEVLRVVGATTDYVRRPFVLEGAVQGAFGAFLAVLISLVLFALLRSGFDEQLTLFFGTQPRFLPVVFSVALVLSGATLGGLAAFLSLRRAVLV